MDFEIIAESKGFKVEKKKRDKADTATIDKVLDSKTINILNQLAKRCKLYDLGGSFSCGKEANIYTARCSTSLISKFTQSAFSEAEECIIPVVLKIYKTSTMLFKDRTRYIIDEKRFKNFCKSNSRKLIKVWSEKEVRNLKRLIKHGILCPKPIYLKRSILIMTIIGDNTPAPTLKNLDLKLISEWDIIYEKCIKLILDMYQKAKLIHADFSEYNLIYYNDEVYVIDVSQSMDISQENSNTFLVMDICNCNDFFQKKGVKVHSEIELFERITKLRVPEYLKIDGKLNKDSFIPTRIVEVANKEDLSLFLTEPLKEKDDLEDNNYNQSFVDDSDGLINGFNNLLLEKDTDINTNSNQDSEDEDGSSVNIESNEIEEIEENSNDAIRIAEQTEAHFNLTKYADLSIDKINIYCRRLRLKNPNVTKEEEKIINRERKIIVKQMNKERRISKVIRKEQFSKKSKKKKITSINK